MSVHATSKLGMTQIKLTKVIVGAPALAPYGALRLTSAEHNIVIHARDAGMVAVLTGYDQPTQTLLTSSLAHPGDEYKQTVDISSKSGIIQAVADGFARVTRMVTSKLTKSEWITKFGEVPQCYACGLPMRWKTGTASNGDEYAFWGCTGYKSSSCRVTMNKDENGDLPPKCPDCLKPMRMRDGKRGAFWGCSGYPDCNRTIDGGLGSRLTTSVADWMPDGPAVAPTAMGPPVASPTNAGGMSPLPLFSHPDDEVEHGDIRYGTDGETEVYNADRDAWEPAGAFIQQAGKALPAPPPPAPEKPTTGMTMDELRARFRKA